MTTYHSPNFTPGRLGNPVEGIIVHHSECLEPLVTSIFLNGDPNQSGGRRSTHYLVCRDGGVVQYVGETDTAWGAGNWLANLTHVNIEFEEIGDDFTDAQYTSGRELISAIAARHGFPVNAETVKPHKDFTATACPGSLNVELLATPLAQVDQEVGPTVAATQAVATPISSGSRGALLLGSYGLSLDLFHENLSPSQTYSDEVKRVQEFLVKEGFMQAPPEGQWGYYGPKTQAAVHAFQGAHGILKTSEYGWWYDLTRAAANKLISTNQA